MANTHVHADHVTGSGELKNRLQPDVVQSIISQVSGAKADIHVKHGDIIECGESVKLQVSLNKFVVVSNSLTSLIIYR